MKRNLFIFAFLLFLPSRALGREECHMYTPYGYQRIGGSYRIGPYSSRSDCESVNSSYFEGQGRCDCEEIPEPAASYSGTGTPSSPGSTGSSWQAPQEAEIWQRQQEEQRRWEQERIRRGEEKRRLNEEAARKAAKAERERLEWKQKKEELMGALRGTAPTDIKLKTEGEEIELKPKGTDFFGIFSEKEENGMAIKARKVSPRRQEPSAAAFENLRRALWLYQKAAQAKDPEEARFLSEQADEAAQGHALRVEVPPAAQTPRLTQKELQQFEKLATVVAQDRIRLDEAKQHRKRLEDERVIMKNKLTALKQNMEAQKSQAPPPAPQQTETPLVSAPPVTEIPPAPSQTITEEPKPEKKKGGEDLMAEFLALEEEIQKTDKKVDDILKEEGKAKQALGKSQQKLDQFAKR